MYPVVSIPRTAYVHRALSWYFPQVPCGRGLGAPPARRPPGRGAGGRIRPGRPVPPVLRLRCNMEAVGLTHDPSLLHPYHIPLRSLAHFCWHVRVRVVHIVLCMCFLCVSEAGVLQGSVLRLRKNIFPIFGSLGNPDPQNLKRNSQPPPSEGRERRLVRSPNDVGLYGDERKKNIPTRNS